MTGRVSARRVPIAVALFYGVGETAIAVQMILFGLFLLFFYTAVLHLPGTLAGLGSALGLAWDAVIDPYIGYRSDSSGGRFGRRHGYMLAGALTMGVSFWLLLSPPHGLGTAALFGWLVATTLLFRTSSALFRIPYLSLGAELSPDYDERTAIVGARSFFGVAGTLLAGWLSFALFDPGGAAAAPDRAIAAGRFSSMGLTFGLLMTLGSVGATVATIGHRSWPEPGPALANDPWAMLRGARSALGNHRFRAVWVAVTLFFLAVVLNASMALHYFSWYVRVTDPQVLGRVQVIFYLGVLAGVLLWVQAARRAEKQGLAVKALLVTALLLTLATAALGEGSLFGIANPLPLMAGHLLAGLAAAALWVLPGSMLADVADDDELAGGRRREGLFFGLLNFGEKVGAGAALLLVGLLLDHVVGLVPGETPSALATARLGWIYGVLPACVLVVAAWRLRAYDLDRSAVAQIQAQLGRGPGSAVAAAHADGRDRLGQPLRRPGLVEEH